ncbi:MAG: LamG-like jellyroll fold domain-containing protein [Pseudomonadota bacterium]
MPIRLVTALAAALLTAACSARDDVSIDPDMPLPPTASSDNLVIQASPGQSVKLVASARDPDGEIAGHEWRSGDSQTTSGDSEFEVSFEEPGWHTVSYRARDNDGLWSNRIAFGIQVGPEHGTDYALRLNGGGSNDDGRAKILIDNVGFDEPGPRIDVGAEDFTIEFRLRGSADDNGHALEECQPNAWIYGNIVVDRDRYGQGRAFGISVLNGKIAFGVSSPGGEDFTICGETVVDDNRWHHVAVTRAARNGRLSIFVDGRLDERSRGPRGDISYPDNGIPADYCDGPCFFSDPFLVLGAEKHDVGPEWRGFTGTIDDLRISAGLRYKDDFEVPPHPLGPDEQTIALYLFNEGRGTALVDSAQSSAPRTSGFVSKGGDPAAPTWIESDVD